MSKITCINVIIKGRVQGVFFRAETQKTAKHLNLTGYVKNRSDGSVEALFQGNEDAAKKMIEWCRTGPPASRVDHVLTEPTTVLSNSKTFDILY